MSLIPSAVQTRSLLVGLRHFPLFTHSPTFQSSNVPELSQLLTYIPPLTRSLLYDTSSNGSFLNGERLVRGTPGAYLQLTLTP